MAQDALDAAVSERDALSAKLASSGGVDADDDAAAADAAKGVDAKMLEDAVSERDALSAKLAQAEASLKAESERGASERDALSAKLAEAEASLKGVLGERDAISSSLEKAEASLKEAEERFEEAGERAAGAMEGMVRREEVDEMTARIKADAKKVGVANIWGLSRV
jgi:chromosome segregation ATPase